MLTGESATAGLMTELTRRRRRWRTVVLLVALVGVAGGNLAARGRSLAFFTPDSLRAEAKLRLHWFVFSKWFNRFFDLHQSFPADLAAAAAEQREDAGRYRTDPWGSPYQITLFPKYFEVRSAGPDRGFGTADDRVLQSRRPEVERLSSLRPAE